MELTQNTVKAVDELRSSRRAAIMMGGAALAGLVLARTAQAQTAVTDTDILNFALNLEYLEAQFYTLATTGMTIDQLATPISTSSGATPPVAGGTVTVKANPMVPFSTPLLQQYAMETAQEERNHVSYLKSALAANGVAMPNLDLQTSFQTLATAALGSAGASFDPFADETSFLLGAFIFEDVGVTAYKGAASLITTSAYLNAASGILAVEAYHAGSIRTRIFAAGATAQSISQSIATTRAKLDGTSNDDIGVGTDSTGAATIVDADSSALAFSRTTTQVLSVVYGGVSGGGAFFPNGMNGNIK